VNPRGVTPEAVDLVSSEDDTARVASCPGERGPVTRPAPRTTVRVPVEGRRAEVRRNSPRTRNRMALRPRDAVRCLAPCSAARGRRSLRIEPAKRHRIRRCRQVRSSFGRSRTKVRAEVRPPPPWLNGPWLVPETGIRRTSRESRLQGIAPSGKPYLRLGVWPIRGPVLSWAFTSPGDSPPVSWGRLHDPVPRDR
jgi:hypothetical protein